VFLMIGAQPNTTWRGGCVALDAKGFVKTGTDLTAEDMSRTRWPVARAHKGTNTVLAASGRRW
jgi:thioredoxin reductase (NADPH)